ncbi:MAG: hypothetical protein R3202_06675 [Candidatus Competibacterales bacterium]|nr:hypothetical protein [Candidatus Competibacterales bacterium]
MHFAAGREFRNWPHKAITLVGMSGVGKTTLANRISKRSWFHYSVDYRIGTRYLDEPILDEVKRYAMRDPYLAELLRSDSIYIASNLTVDNLQPLSNFLGKLGDPGRGGLPLAEFKRRQRLHHAAEIQALRDVVDFIHKAHDIYGYPNFLNDAGGSICELDDPDTLDLLCRHTLLLYIRSDTTLEDELVRRAARQPKPLYYQEDFLDARLEEYLAGEPLESADTLDPDAFVTWMFPRLLRHRLPRYQTLADRHGYMVDYHAAAEIRDEQDFIDLIAETIDRRAMGPASPGADRPGNTL